MILFILSLLSLCYIVYIYLFYFIRVDKPYKQFNKPFSVIIPCFNEGYKELTGCVESILKANGTKQVIIVNNKSTKEETKLAILDLIRKYPNLEVYQENRQGKRFAHSKGLEHAKHDLIVFVDSDTLVGKNALLELIKPFQDNSIGAVCGNIKIKNRNDNFLTKCLDTMYWNSFEVYRYAVSGLGYLQVCSGALASYRKELLLKLEDEYLTETFLGNQCMISDDSFMTIRVQSRFGYKIAYQNKAIGYTYSPNKIKDFWKQMVRWRQGFIKETITMWKEPKKNIIPLFLDVQTNLLLQSSISLIRIYFLFQLIFFFNPASILNYLFVFLVSAMMLSSAQIVYHPKKILYILGYSFMYDFFFTFTFIHAVIKIKNQGKWATR